MSDTPSGPRAPDPPPAVGGWLHGVGEVAGFFGAAAWAVVELAIGRWPGPRPPGGGRAGKRRAVAPYPAHD